MKKLKTDYGRRELSSLLRGLDKCDSVSFWYQMSRIASTATGMDHAEQIAKHRDNLIEHGRTTDPERQARIDELEHERDALAAHLDNLPDALRDLASGEGYCCCGMRMDTHSFNDGHAPVDSGWYAMEKYMQQAPATSLARRDASVAAEALDEALERVRRTDDPGGSYWNTLQKYRRQAEGGDQ